MGGKYGPAGWCRRWMEPQEPGGGAWETHKDNCGMSRFRSSPKSTANGGSSIERHGSCLGVVLLPWFCG